MAETPFMVLKKNQRSGKSLTDNWTVLDTGDATLGHIRWYSAWRRYVFHPVAGTLFDAACLTQMSEFLQARTNDQKADAAKRLAEKKARV